MIAIDLAYDDLHVCLHCLINVSMIIIARSEASNCIYVCTNHNSIGLRFFHHGRTEFHYPRAMKLQEFNNP